MKLRKIKNVIENTFNIEIRRKVKNKGRTPSLFINEAINFENPGQPGYMPPTTRREGDKTYTAEELKKSLSITSLIEKMANIFSWKTCKV